MITAVIPAKNESATIGRLVMEVSKYCDEVIVVLSPSDQDTLNSVPKSARVVFEEAVGKGVAMRHGARSSKGDLLVFIDADLSHDPSEIPRLIEPILRGDADHVVASRMLGGSSELFYDFSQFVRLCGSHVITLCINFKFQTRMTDSQNGFRAIKKELFLALDLREQHTTIEQEMTVKSLRLGTRLLEVSAHEYSRAAGISKIQVYRHGWRYILLLFRFLLQPKPKGWKGFDMSAVTLKYNKPWFTDGST